MAAYAPALDHPVIGEKAVSLLTVAGQAAVDGIPFGRYRLTVVIGARGARRSPVYLECFHLMVA